MIRVWFDGTEYQAEWGVYAHGGRTPFRARWNVVLYRQFGSLGPRWKRAIYERLVLL